VNQSRGVWLAVHGVRLMSLKLKKNPKKQLEALSTDLHVRHSGSPIDIKPRVMVASDENCNGKVRKIFGSGDAGDHAFSTLRQSRSDKQLAFDVASIKPIAPPIPASGGPWITGHGRFRAETGNVRGVIAWAYNLNPAQVHAGPVWLDREPYFFDARSEDQDAGPKQVRAMLQTLLADRLKLVVHREMQMGQVYTLTVGKSGSKIQATEDGGKGYINWAGPGQVMFTECPITGLINILSSTLGRPVIDETQLKGLYNFKLEFEDPRFIAAGQPSIDSRPGVFDALQEQLGLKLDAKKSSVEILVIDHIARPSEN
jgi:uncharacterized protein (TIGR03435 family)